MSCKVTLYCKSGLRTGCNVPSESTLLLLNKVVVFFFTEVHKVAAVSVLVIPFCTYSVMYVSTLLSCACVCVCGAGEAPGLCTLELLF